MEKYISDDKLAKVHDEGLSATTSKLIAGEEVKVPDYQTRHKYLDTGYKLKGKLIDRSVNLNLNISKVLDDLDDGQEA